MAKTGNPNVLIIGVDDIVKAQHSNLHQHPTVPRAYTSLIKQVLMTQFLESSEPNTVSNLLDSRGDEKPFHRVRMNKQKTKIYAPLSQDKERSETPSLLVRKRPAKHHRYEMLTQQNFTSAHSPVGNASSEVFRSVMNSIDVGPAQTQVKKLGNVWRDKKKDGKRLYSRCVFEIPLPKEFSPEQRNYTQFKMNETTTSQGDKSNLLKISGIPKKRNHTLQSFEIQLKINDKQKLRTCQNQFKPRCTNTSIKFLRRPTNGSNFAAHRLQKKMTSFSNNIQLAVRQMKLNHKQKHERLEKQFDQRVRRAQRTAYNRTRSQSVVAAAQPHQRIVAAPQKRSQTFLSPWLDIFQDFQGF